MYRSRPRYEEAIRKAIELAKITQYLKIRIGTVTSKRIEIMKKTDRLWTQKRPGEAKEKNLEVSSSTWLCKHQQESNNRIY